MVLSAAAAVADPRDEGAERGWLAGLDPRAKVVGFLGLLVGVALARSPLALAACLVWVAVLALAGGVGWKRLRVSLAALPLAAVVLSLPAALNVVTPGRTLIVMCHLGTASWGPWRFPEVLAVTDRGLYVAGRLALRVAACLSIGALLASSTRPRDLARGFRGVGVPSAFVLVFDLTVRYLAVLLQSAEEIHLAKLSRSIVRLSARRDQVWAAAGIGELYRKSRAMAEAVADAMSSRGFTGDVRYFARARWGAAETAFAGACAVVAVVVSLVR